MNCGRMKTERISLSVQFFIYEYSQKNNNKGRDRDDEKEFRALSRLITVRIYTRR